MHRQRGNKTKKKKKKGDFPLRSRSTSVPSSVAFLSTSQATWKTTSSNLLSISNDVAPRGSQANSGHDILLMISTWSPFVKSDLAVRSINQVVVIKSSASAIESWSSSAFVNQVLALRHRVVVTQVVAPCHQVVASSHRIATICHRVVVIFHHQSSERFSFSRNESFLLAATGGPLYI